MLLIFDTETTGLYPGQIGQLSYLMAEGAVVQARNWFFAVDSMPESARAIHGFSAEDLARLSDGRRFADDAEEILADFKAAEVVAGHNLDFDMAFLRAELNRCGLRFRLRHGLCTMKYFTKPLAIPGRYGRPKPPSLKELTAYFDAGSEEIARQAEEWFQGGGSAHDARYDATATMICVRRAIERGLLRNLFVERKPARDETLEV